MKTNARALLGLLLVVLASMFLSGCKESYGCQVTFGSSSCTPSGGGLGGGGTGGGGGGGTARAFAFAVDQNGTIDSFALSSSAFTATTNSVSTTITSNPGAGMVVAQQVGQQPFVYALFGPLGNELFGWSMSASGVLALLPSLPAPLVLNLDASIPFNQYSMTTNPAGTLLFIADTFSNEIFVFQIASTGALTVVNGSPFATPVSPGNLTTDGLGKYLYVTETVVDHTGVEILGYSIGDGTNGTTLGALTELSSSPFTFPKNMWQVQGDASGLFLVGTTGNSASTEPRS